MQHDLLFMMQLASTKRQAENTSRKDPSNKVLTSEGVRGDVAPEISSNSVYPVSRSNKFGHGTEDPTKGL